MSAPYQLYVGVAIAAKTLTATGAVDPAVAPTARTFDQTDAGFISFPQALATCGVAPQAVLLVREATGSSWIALAVALQQAGYVVSVRNPGQVALFARSLPWWSTTDALDAHLRIRFADARQPPLWPPRRSTMTCASASSCAMGCSRCAPRPTTSAMPVPSGRSRLPPR